MIEKIPIVDYVAPQEKIIQAKQLPSHMALSQESGRIVRDTTQFSFDSIIIRLGFGNLQTIIGNLRLYFPDINKASNIVKTRLARAMVVHHLLDNNGLLPNSQLGLRAIDIIMTDFGLREDLNAVIGISKKDYCPETAMAKDNTYIRTHGGNVLELRLKEGRLKREQAVAIASFFECNQHKLSVIQKAQIINFFVNNPNGAEISFSTDGVKPDQVREIIFDIRMRARILTNAISHSFSKSEAYSFLPLSQLSGIIKDVMEEFNDCRTASGLRNWIEKVKAEDLIPTKLSSLTDILKVVKNHPELKAVSFDLYDTLVQWTSNQGERRVRMDEISADLLRRKYNINVDQARFNRASSKAWDRRWKDFQEKGNEVKIEDTIGWMVDDILFDSAATHGINLTGRRDEIIKDLIKSWYRIELETAVPVPGAVETLKRLKAMGLKICLTSNASWSEEHVRRVLNRFNLLQYFDAISISAEIGKMKKPTLADFFHHSWSKIKMTPEQVYHIGDNPWDDVQGAQFAGAKSSQFANPNAFNIIEIDPRYYKDSGAYVQKAMEFHTRSQNSEALQMIDDYMERYNVPIEERERLAKMAREVYQKTRDVIGPAYLLMAHEILQKLAKGEADLSLSMARDALPIVITQKLLLNAERERYNGISANKIKYIHISRRFIDRTRSDPAFKAMYLDYLRQFGIDKANRIIVSDIICGSGKTHQGVVDLLPGKHIEGYYIDSHQNHRFSNIRSFLTEYVAPNANLSTQNMLLLLEALFSGPYESAYDFDVNKAGEVMPLKKRKKLPADVLVRGLSEQSILMLNTIAVRGLIDATETLHRKRLLGIPDKTPQSVMGLFYYFISSPPSGEWVDIWRSIPWQDSGKWFIASANPIEDGINAKKI